MAHVTDLINSYFNVSGGELYLSRVPVHDITERYGTPLFIYDRHALDRKWNLLRSTFPDEFAISYSVKANPNRQILRYFVSKGCGLEIASGGEFNQALASGCPAKRIVFAGPGKTPVELEYVIKNGIAEIHVESVLEAERIAGLSRQLGLRTRIAIRVNPVGEAQGGAMRMGGKPTQFGVDEETLDVVLDRILSMNALDFCGIHLYTGTQILDWRVLLRQYQKGLEIARRVATHIRHPLHTVDFGGGLGIPYFSFDKPLDMMRLREGLEELGSEIRGEPRFSGTQFMIEPGRFLVGEAGIYVVRVIDIKVSRGKKFVITDGGMHHHLAASGNLGQTIKRNYPAASLTKLGYSPEEIVDVVGSLCTPLDVLARSLSLAKVEIGDLVGFFQSGAYARTASPLGFLSHPSPPEVWVEDKHDYLIRRRGNYEDYLSDLLEVNIDGN